MKETDFVTKETRTESDVIKFYDEYAREWDGRFNSGGATEHFVQRRWRSFANVLAAENRGTETAVELGVGTGVYIDKAAGLLKQIVAVDGSQGMLDELQKKLSARGIANVTTMRADVVDLTQVPSGSADVVYFFGLIEHIVHVDKFVAEIHRVLKLSGIVIGVTPNGASPWYGVRKLIRSTGKHCTSDHYYTAQELRSLFGPDRFAERKIEFWGAVPAGISSTPFAVLKALEPAIEASPLARFLGGMTFCFRKRDA